MRLLWQDHDWRAYLQRHPNLVAYVLITAVFAITTFRLQNVIEKQRTESDARSVIACRVINENKALVRDFTDVLITVSTANPPPNQTLAQREQQQRAISQFQQLLAPRLEPIDCGQFLRFPERYLQSPTSPGRPTTTTSTTTTTTRP